MALGRFVLRGFLGYKNFRFGTELLENFLQPTHRTRIQYKGALVPPCLFNIHYELQ